MVRRERRRRREVQTKAATIPFGSPISRGEWITIAAIVLIAAGLRFAFPSRMAIEHFDEGVYASNIYFGDAEHGQFPYRHLYAPPLLPLLIELGVIVLGPQSIAPFLPALIFGTATVPLAWWSVRCWFGPLAGIVAGVLIATSDFHILYSRTALTDVPVAFFILLAVCLYWEAIRRDSLRWSAAAGIAAGLGWWTKYTGWLPLAIAASGSVAWLLFERRAGGVSPPSHLKVVAKCFTTMAITTLLVWSPVLISLQPFGGYASVAENHRGYLQTWGWVHTAYEQIGNVAAQSGVITAVGAAFLAVAASWRSRRGVIPSLLLALLSGVFLVPLVFEKGPLLPFLLLAIGGLLFDRYATVLVETYDTDAPIEIKTSTVAGAKWRLLAIWLLGAWIAGMSLTVPTYQHFPRLALMWLMPVVIGTTTWVGRLPSPTWKSRPVTHSELFSAAAILAVVVVLVAGELRPNSEFFTARWSVPGWEDRTQLREAASKVAEAVKRRSDEKATSTIVYVLAEPAAFYHVASTLSSDQIGVMPAGHFPLISEVPPGVEVFVVSAPVSRSELERIERHATFLERMSFEPSTLVRLDRESRDSVKDPPTSPDAYSFRLFRVGKARRR